MNNFYGKKVCIIGLGYVGLTLAVHMARRGFSVIGVEKNKNIIASLEQGKAHFYEPKIDLYLQEYIGSKIKLIEKISKSECKAEVYIVSAGTPIIDDKCDLSSIVSISKDLKEILTGEELLVLRSTVKLGTTEWLSEGLKENFPNLHVAFCPERTLEGKALEELSFLPQIIGSSNPATSQIAQSFFSELTDSTIIVSDAKTAEMIKLTDNSQRDVWFAYANEVAVACDNIGIDAYEVIKSGSLGYERSNLALPGPVGGPCLSKDPYILHESLEEFDCNMPITITSRRVNENVISHCTKFLSLYFKNNPPKKITISGMAFKGTPPTSDLRGSPSVDLLKELQINFEYSNICLFDPNCRKYELQDFNLDVAEDFKSAFLKTDLFIFATNNPHNRDIEIKKYLKYMPAGAVIFDLWGMHKEVDFNTVDVDYICFGDVGENKK